MFPLTYEIWYEDEDGDFAEQLGLGEYEVSLENLGAGFDSKELEPAFTLVKEMVPTKLRKFIIAEVDGIYEEDEENDCLKVMQVSPQGIQEAKNILNNILEQHSDTKVKVVTELLWAMLEHKAQTLLIEAWSDEGTPLSLEGLQHLDRIEGIPFSVEGYTSYAQHLLRADRLLASLEQTDGIKIVRKSIELHLKDPVTMSDWGAHSVEKFREMIHAAKALGIEAANTPKELYTNLRNR